MRDFRTFVLWNSSCWMFRSTSLVFIPLRIVCLHTLRSSAVDCQLVKDDVCLFRVTFTGIFVAEIWATILDQSPCMFDVSCSRPTINGISRKVTNSVQALNYDSKANHATLIPGCWDATSACL